MIGGFLQAKDQLGREMAQLSHGRKSRLAQADPCGSIRSAVAVRILRAGTGSLNRYPSPDGRSALPLGTSPVFSAGPSSLSADRRSLAHGFGCGGPGQGTDLDVAALSPGYTHNRKGYQVCNLPNGSQALFAQSHLQLVATRRLSRALSGPAQARARRSCWMATRSPALLSAARPTSSIASVTPRAAEGAAGLTPPATFHISSHHRTLTRSGGFLLSEEPSTAGQPPRGKEPEGT